jgi:hypothetical protein
MLESRDKGESEEGRRGDNKVALQVKVLLGFMNHKMVENLSCPGK